MANQVLFLMKTLLMLKSWRLAFLLPVIALCLLGIQGSHVLLQGWMASVLKHGLRVVTARSFFASSRAYIIGSVAEFAQQVVAISKIFGQLNTEGMIASEHYDDCSGLDSCFAHIYSAMLLNRDQVQHYYTDYGQAIALCQADYGSMLDCSFLGNVATLAHYCTADRKHWYKNYHTFQLVALPGSAANQSASDGTLCTTERSFFLSLPKLLTFEMTLVTATVCCYLLASTVTCIDELKSRGFLQLMFRRGLSVFSFWASVWLLTTCELLLLAVSLTASFYLQCPGFYSITRIAYTFLIVGSHMLNLAALILLLTVVCTDYYAVCKSTLVYIVTSAACMLAGRLAHESSGGLDMLKVASLALPWANVAEQLQANLVGQVSPEAETNLHTAGLVLNGSVLAIIGMVTLYLDHVLKTGNGLCYPAFYLCGSVPAGKDMPPENDADPCVESLDLGVFVRMTDVSRMVQGKIEGGISVDIYEDQVAAIVGSDSIRSGSLLSVLTGRLPVISGQVWVDGCVASRPMSRPYVHTRLGECPQADALSHRLTVSHTLATALVACGKTWAESEDDVNKVATLLHLLDKLPRTVGTLSAGQKRKLCVALALLGDPRLVVLHDPTRGLDPLSRQRLWRLLQDFRQGRCIVLSTQFADEADLFADWKVLVSADSALVCAGTSAFIRRSLGCGQMLRAELKDDHLAAEVLETLRAELPSEAKARVQGALLTVGLSNRDAHLMPKVVLGLKAVEQHIELVGLTHMPLSSIYRQLKGMDAQELASMFHNSRTNMHDMEPKVADEGPKEADVEPQVAGEEPKVADEEPKVADDEPKVADEEPKEVGEEPKVAGEEPKVADVEPHVVVDEDAEPQSSHNVDEDGEILGQGGDEEANATQQAEKPEVIEEEDQQTTCPKAACGIFTLHCCLLRGSPCRLVARLLIPALLLTIHALMLVLEKHAMASKSAVWANLSSLPAKRYSRGFCIADEDISPNHRIDGHRCSKFYTGATTLGDNFLALHKLRATPLYEFLLQPNLMDQFYEHCFTNSKPGELPCPIVYATTWYTGAYNMERQLSIGSYSSYSRYQPELSAATAFLVSQSALTYFSRGELTANFKLAVFVDFRSVLMPLYGTFFHIFLLTILPSLYLNDIMDHQVSEWRPYLASMGVSTLGYWTSTYIFHWLHYATVYGLVIGLSLAICPSIYLASYQLAVIGITVSCGLFNNLMAAYLFSSVFCCSRRVTIMVHLLLSILVGISVTVVQSMDMVSIVMIAALPPFATGSLTFFSVKLYTYLVQLNEHGQQINLPGIDRQYMYNQRQIWMCLISIPVQTVALIVLLVIVESVSGIFQRCCCAQGGKSSDHSTPRGAGDQEALNNSGAGGDHQGTIELLNMGKTFAGRVEAVRNLSLKVAAGETVAVFGPNGSGVTTALSVVTGRLRASSGSCQVSAGRSGTWVSGRQVGSKRLVALAPQPGRLFASLTVAEHLRCYARMLGAPSDRVAQLVRDLGLQHCKDTPAHWLAEGDSRRLSLAIALLSGAPLLFIDDASSGIEPDAQPGLWRAIADSAGSRASVVVSAHSLAGAAAALKGVRVALVNHGFLAGLGTVEQLWRRHGTYMLELEIDAESDDLTHSEKAALLKALVGRFFSIEILDQSQHWMKLAVPQESAQPALASLNWLLRLQARHRSLVAVLFQPASIDQMLEPILRQHDKEVLESSAAPAAAAADLAPMPEYYEV